MSEISPKEVTECFRRAPAGHIECDGGALGYRKFGSGPDVLFVHGWPVSGATFRKLIPELAPHMTCHVLDLVGTAGSRFSRDADITLEGHIRAVRQAVDALGLERVAVVGNDSGGLIARHAMAGDPRLRALVLINTEQPQGLSWKFRQFLWMSKLPAFEHILAGLVMKRGLRRNPMLLGDTFCDHALIEGEFEEFFLAPLRDDLDLRWACGRLIANFDTRYVAELGEVHKRITCPVRLIWGEDDPFFPVKLARDMVGTFPNASLQTVAGAKLFVHEECPTDVARAMLEGLTSTVH